MKVNAAAPLIFPLSAYLSLVVGTSVLRELSFLVYAAPDHSLAPHHVLVLHNACARLAAGPSLVAGIDTPPEPVVRGLVSCLGAALQTHQERYLLPRRVQGSSCSFDYAMETPHSFLPGSPRSGCSNSASLQEAQGHCESLPGCGGYTAVRLVFRAHLGSKPSPSKLVPRCWLRRCGKGFAWCNKDGVYYCSDSCKRHILQFCGSSWAHGAVPALADRIEYARGETGLDINPSAQHLLNCDLRGNHFRSRLLLSSLASPEEFTWCNKDGMHSFTESRKQRIPQFCGSCWSLRSVSDKFQFVRGEKGIDINPSVQHLLNCGGVRSCHGGSFSLCSSMKTPHSFLPGSPRSGCSNSASLQEAQGHCESLPGCGGFTAVRIVFRVLLGSKPSPSQLVQRCWLRRCGKGFAWCNKDSLYYCSDSCQRDILQFCGSSWAHGAVSALADRIKYARGETGLDITHQHSTF